MYTAHALQARPRTSREIAAIQAAKRAQEIKKWIEETQVRRAHTRRPHVTRRQNAHGHDTQPMLFPGRASLIERWRELAWQRRWEDSIRKLPPRHSAIVWRTPWAQDPRMLYAGLSKAEATALFLMRTEVIGLNAWLAAVQVPGITPSRPCGWHAQTVRHVLMHCLRHERISLIQACGTERIDDILTRPTSVKQVAHWLICTGVMDQFRVAAEVAEEDIGKYKAFLAAEEW